MGVSDIVSSVIEIDPQQDVRWKDFVNAHPDGLVYQLPSWLRCIERAFPYEPSALAYEDERGSLLGILPLFHQRGLLTGSCFSSLPHTPVAGPLAYDPEVRAALVAAALRRVEERPGSWLQLKLPSLEFEGLGDGISSVPWRSTYVLSLAGKDEELRLGSAENHNRIRWAVKKASRLGVQVRPAGSEHDLKAWHLLYLDTMRSLRLLPFPYAFFKAMWEELRPAGNMTLLIAEREQDRSTELLAGALFLMSGQTVFYAFSARRRDAMSLRPNEAIQWRAIQDARARGFRRYDLGEVPRGNDGLANFKRKWGTREEQLYRYYHPSGRELAESSDNPSSPILRLTTFAWGRLPLRATAFIGGGLRRYL
ncbi:MAG: peptidoglycan bridge formation glycyltransferase FemA/FemB family protein [Actinomycetota bacterium]|nr:peptidoglycan bridge formation glycyltransferase FemA/FemB family protein [Actinomycetota bacterium]